MHSRSAWRGGLGWVCALILWTGCVPPQTDSNPSPVEQVLASPAPRPPASSTYQEAESNDTFAAAEPVTVDGSIDLVGSIRAGAMDKDLYELGSAGSGDRIQAELTVARGDDIVLGVLDENGHLIGFLDLSSSTAGPKKMDIFLHEQTNRLYIIVSTRTTSANERSYTAHVALQRGAGLPDERPQVVVLNFQGGQGVRVAGRAAIDVPAFDISRIGTRFTGQTDVVVANIVSMTREAFDGLNVQIYAAGDPSIPDGPHSTLYYGTYDNQLLGLADNVDPYNTDPEQTAILYTDTFALFDVLSPDPEAISQVLANTTSHEIGHLVGLRHTADVQDIMDTTATARQMLVRQWFGTVNLNTSVISLGTQDAPNLLSWTLGGVLSPPPSSGRLVARQKAIQLASRGLDFYVPRSQLMSGHCDTCDAQTPEP